MTIILLMRCMVSRYVADEQINKQNFFFHTTASLASNVCEAAGGGGGGGVRLHGSI